MNLELPEDKREKIYTITENISRKSEISIREFAKFTGTLPCGSVRLTTYKMFRT